jgi:hypothetical protein
MKLFTIAALATILAVTVSAVPMEKRASCKIDDGIKIASLHGAISSFYSIDLLSSLHH